MSFQAQSTLGIPSLDCFFKFFFFNLFRFCQWTIVKAPAFQGGSEFLACKLNVQNLRVPGICRKLGICRNQKRVFANAEVNSGNTVAAGLAAPWLGRIANIYQPQPQKWPYNKIGRLGFLGCRLLPIYLWVHADVRCTYSHVDWHSLYSQVETSH